MPSAHRFAAHLSASRFAVLLLLVFCFATLTPAQAPSKEEVAQLRQKAIALYREHKNLEALPMFRTLAAALPEDGLVLEGYASCLMSYASTLKDQKEKDRYVLLARRAFEDALKHGNNSSYVLIMLEITPADGKLPPFSEKENVDAAIREGEAAFAARDMEKAEAAYRKALSFDPQNYTATLFLGDTYFGRKDYANAVKWFSQAAAIDPTRETAFRYAGDALLLQGKTAEARDMYIEAILAQPYSRRPWAGILNWAKKMNLTLTHPRIESPNETRTEDGKTNIRIDSATLDKDDGSNAWIAYEIGRAAWKASIFKEKFPKEAEYRHSLAEEADALRAVLEVFRAGLKDGSIKKPHAALDALHRLEADGLLEAFILLAKPDEGIVKDYDAYCASNPDKLRRYILEWVIPKGSS